MAGGTFLESALLNPPPHTLPPLGGGGGGGGGGAALDCAVPPAHGRQARPMLSEHACSSVPCLMGQCDSLEQNSSTVHRIPGSSTI